MKRFPVRLVFWTAFGTAYAALGVFHLLHHRYLSASFDAVIVTAAVFSLPARRER